jgi:esterase/lipase superfamily enzyme
MQTESHRWYSHRLGREMGVVVYGHYGLPVLAFPTSGGAEWELENMGLIPALAPYVDGGRVKIFTVGSNSDASWYNTGAHPFHRSWMQRMFDEYIRWEVIPFIHAHSGGLLPIATMGASLGAFHAANTLFKRPDAVKRCWAMSGPYDMRRFMDGMSDENFYFNNPIDYVGGMNDWAQIGLLNTCDIHIATGNGPWEKPEHSYHLSRVLASKGIHHHLDNWGLEGGHDWPYWKHQMWHYLREV